MDRRTFLSRSGQLLVLTEFLPNVLVENPMSEKTPGNNQRRNLSFSNDWIESVLVTSAREMAVEDAIVVNLSTSPLQYSAGKNQGSILPWKSTMLRGCTIDRADAAALLHVRQRTNLGGVALGWDWYGHRNPEYPRGTPLYISSEDDIGEVQFDPILAFTFTRETPAPASPRRYRVKLNLWYTPEETDCGIHTGHQFLEVHTQVLGTGHMQKFRENNAETLYEDVPMLPGMTHDAFFGLTNDRSFRYPWHRYYAETNCIWMAVELH